MRPTLYRAAIHASLVALYGLGGYLVSRGLMPLRVLLSAIGFTFSLVFATQGCVQTFSDAQRALMSLARSAFLPLVHQPFLATISRPPQNVVLHEVGFLEAVQCARERFPVHKPSQLPVASFRNGS